jgi:hypothetical protein
VSPPPTRADSQHLSQNATVVLECAIGSSRFLCARRPAETSLDGITLYTIIFQNWSTDWAREGRLIIFFEMPAGQVPVSQIQ